MNKLRLWTGFVLSLFGIVLSCWTLCFNAIALPLKETFNLTQSQVETVSSMTNFAVILVITEPLISAKFGYTLLYTLAWIISPLSASLLYFAARYKTFFSQWVWSIVGFQFLAALCTEFMYMILINIGINNFAKRHTGKLIGLYVGVGALGKVFYASLIELVFESSLEEFFLTISIIWAIVFGACVLFHRRLDNKNPDLLSDVELQEPLENKQSVDHEDRESVPMRNVLKSPHFHLIVCSYASMCGCMYAFMNNLTSFGESAGMENPTYLIYILSGSLTVCRVLSGLLFDKLKTPASRFALVILCHLIFIVAMIILLVQFTVVILYVVAVLIGIAMVAAFSLPLTMLVDRFGRKNYGMIFGIMVVFGPLMVIFYQLLIGFFYDSEAHVQKSNHDCTGKSCFNLTFVIFLISGVFATVLHVINFCLERKRTE